MAEKRTEEKIECFELWMRGDHVMVHLDARAEGVEVPQMHAANPSLALQLSYAFRGETTHDDSEIRSFLKFHGEYFECILPWSAIWGISSAEQDSRIWPQDMPKELLVRMAQNKLQEVGKKVSQKFFGKSSEQDSKTVSTRPGEANSEVKDRPRKTPQLKEVPLTPSKGTDSESQGDKNMGQVDKQDSTDVSSDAPPKESSRRSPQLKRIK